MADNTTLNAPGVIGGDVISTEELPTGGQRGDAALPVTAYKVPRSKIAVGPYDQDLGDVSQTNPLFIRTLWERQLQEEEALRLDSLRYASMRTRNNSERSQYMDSRGWNYRGSNR